MKTLHYLCPYRIQERKQVATLEIASIRLRLKALQSAIEGRPYNLIAGDKPYGKTDICIVGKLAHADTRAGAEHWLGILKQYRKAGIRILLDYTDDHLNNIGDRTFFYRSCIEYVDLCVASSRKLEEQVRRAFERVLFIPDPLEVESVPPRAPTRGEPRTLFWFGHPSNLVYLKRFLVDSGGVAGGTRLIVMTNDAGIGRFMSENPSMPASVQLRFARWSVDNMRAVARTCDVCIIPSDAASAEKQGVSSNRLITALALGLPTAADLMDSYAEFRDYFADIRSPEFDDMMKDPASWHTKITEAQHDVLPQYSLRNIGGRWLHAIEAGW